MNVSCMLEHKRISCDVLIIGGGPAGMRAAIEAGRLGVDTAMVVKRRLGRSGNVMVSHTGHNAPFGHIDGRDSPEVYFQDTVVAGYFINNQKLVEVLAREACPRVAELEGFGIKFEMSDDKYNQRHAPGHSYPRSCYTPRRRGLDLTLPLVKAVRALGTRVFEDIMTVAITQKEGTASGAIGFDRISGEMIAFEAKALVLATGGAGQVFSMTNNAADMTGDGYSIAFNAGAELIDMEFFQFYPQMLIHPFWVTVSPILFKHGARLFNAKRERFMRRYDPTNLDAATRDIKSRAIRLEVMEGRGVKGGVYLDLSEVNKEDLRALNPDLYGQIKKRSLDYRKSEFIVSPVAHFYMGGVKINEKGETTVRGLYACGEVTGGVHGANRLANNAHTETIVFGARAGEYAARWAKSAKKIHVDEEEINKIARLIKRIGGGQKEIREVKSVFQEAMWRNVGVVRNRSGLEEALGLIEEQHGLMEEIKARTPIKITETLELFNMLTIGKLMALTALTRTESRGAHYRSDHPKRDDKKWLKNIIAYRNKKGEVKVKLSDIVTTKIEGPTVAASFGGT